ncbi:hypothetical protein VRK_00770 [Vibrio sp. MEBiC08052]|nr:hypothetical protein VRK_00770 [Vibrio sp. MEBiC08052]
MKLAADYSGNPISKPPSRTHCTTQTTSTEMTTKQSAGFTINARLTP